MHSIKWPNLIFWLPLLREILGNMCTCTCLLTRLWRHEFEINLIFLIKTFLLHDQKVMTKNETFWERKELLKVKLKAFLIISTGISVIKNCLTPYRAPLNFSMIELDVFFFFCELHDVRYINSTNNNNSTFLFSTFN